jgi:hypothetical protein
MSKQTSIDYYIWLVQKLNNIIAKDKAKADEARKSGDEATAKVYDKFASQAETALGFVENWDVASYTAILRTEAKAQTQPTA